MNVQYKQVVIWDASLIDVGFLGSEQSVPLALRGLACNAIKITTGAPAATVGQWIPAAQVYNAISGVIYQNTGTTASPVWAAMAAGNGVTSLTGDVTGSGPGATATTIAANAITTVKILNANVTLAKLAAGITPSHVVKFAGTATGGTTATRAYAVTGALSTDIATAVIRASTNAVSIQKATLTADTLTVLFSGDPGAGTSVDYSVLRAAA